MTSKSRQIRGREIGASEAISEHCLRVQRLKPVPRSHRSAVYELAASAETTAGVPSPELSPVAPRAASRTPWPPS